MLGRHGPSRSRDAPSSRTSPQRSVMALLIGFALAFVVGVFGTVVSLDRDRAFYPTAMIVIASLYVLFAAMGAPPHTLVTELAVGAVFIGMATWGFKSSLWLVVLALAAHGIFDFFHGALVPNPGVPAWWPEFCLAYDEVAAAYLAWLLVRGRVRAAA